MTLYVPDDLGWLPKFESDPDGAPPWFLAAFPHGGLNRMSVDALAHEARCTSVADGLRCIAKAGHYDQYYHRATWDDGAFTLIWGGSI